MKEETVRYLQRKQVERGDDFDSDRDFFDMLPEVEHSLEEVFNRNRDYIAHTIGLDSTDESAPVTDSAPSDGNSISNFDH